MLNTLYGIKKGMISSYDSRGRRVGATLLEVTPNYITQIKTKEKDGYSSVQLGLSEKKFVRKPQIGHLKKAGIDKKLRYIKEVKTEETNLEPGKEMTLTQVFKKGDAVKVTATSKGKGFQGGVRRWGFHGGPKTHGQSDRHRAPGSIGSGTTPGRVLKGKHMAGHMGVDTVTYAGLEVIGIDKEKNILTLKGGIPGPIGGLVRIENTGKIKGYTAPPEEKEDEEEEGEKEAKGADESQESKESEAGAEAPAGTVSAQETPAETPTENPAESAPVKQPAEAVEGEQENA